MKHLNKIGLIALLILTLYIINEYINNTKKESFLIMNEYHNFLKKNYQNDFNARVPYFMNAKSVFGKARLSVWKKNNLWAIVVEKIVYSYGNAIRNWTYVYGNATEGVNNIETFKNIFNMESDTKLFENEYDCNLATLTNIRNYRDSIVNLPLNVEVYESYFKYNIDPKPSIIYLEKIFYYLIDNNKEDLFSTKDEINSLFKSDLEMVAMTDDWFYDPLGISHWEKESSDVDFINQSVEILLGKKDTFKFEVTNSSWKDY